MGSFDLQKAATILGGGGSPIDAIGMAFGIPDCLIEMGNDLLGLLPSDALGGMAQDIHNAMESANAAFASTMTNLFNQTGLFEYNTNTGKIQFAGDTSKFFVDVGDSQLLKNIGSLANALAFGGTIFNNINVLQQQLDDIKECFDQYKYSKAAKKGLGALANTLGSAYGYPDAENIIDGEDPGVGLAGGDPNLEAAAQYALLSQQLADALAFIEACKKQLNNIGQILLARDLDPSLEPCFMLQGGGTCSLSQYNNKEDCINNDGQWVDNTTGIPLELLSGTTFCAQTPNEFAAGEIEDDDPSAIFRLVYGPPLSKKGQFILSIDGLYYDSQTGGVPEVVGFVPPAEFYKFEQPANLGGKGKHITNADLNIFVSSLFDVDTIDEGSTLKEYYDSDHFLQSLIGEQDKHINMLNTELKTYTADGSSLAIIENKKREIFSQLSRHINKINRRKKQIEVAVKSNTVFGSSATFAPGEIPINDFSYLTALNIIPTLEQQKQIIFEQGDVSEVVLPIHPKFVKGSDTEYPFVAQHLLVPTVGKGSIVYNASTLESDGTSGTATLYSLTDSIITDELISIYNFLEPNVEAPSGTKYGVMNCASSSLYGNAQLLGDSIPSVFVSGLSIPKLRGLVRFKEGVAGEVKGLGSAVRIPDTVEMQNLMYSPTGCTIESWVHVPGLNLSSMSNVEPSGEWGALTLNRVLVGCENIGGFYQSPDVNSIIYSKSDDSVQGFLMGFTRDQQLTEDKSATDSLFAASGSNFLENQGFFVAPTMSYNETNAGFISRSETEAAGATTPEYYKMFIRGDTQLSGVSFNDVSSQFMHICTTFSPSGNLVSVYLDGILMAASGMNVVFGSNVGEAPGIPSFTKDNSFEYNVNTINGPPFYGMDNLKLTKGPSLNPQFTPWMLGGGYSDGYLKTNAAAGFMGNFHGVKSGLNGHMGSVKFYGKALNSSEVLKNFNAQKGYFKNIKT